MQYAVMYSLFWNTPVKTLLWRTPWTTPSLGTSITFETILRTMDTLYSCLLLQRDIGLALHKYRIFNFSRILKNFTLVNIY
jgi:hypothetical protein